MLHTPGTFKSSTTIRRLGVSALKQPRGSREPRQPPLARVCTARVPGRQDGRGVWICGGTRATSSPGIPSTHPPSGGVRMNKKDPAGPGEEQLHELPFSQNPKERTGPAAGRGLGEARWCEGHVGQEHHHGLRDHPGVATGLQTSPQLLQLRRRRPSPLPTSELRPTF